MFYKIFTYDLCSPIQGGKPVWDGTFPWKTPKVKLDTSDAECSSGWNFVDDLAKGFKIAGFWSLGRPTVIVVVEPSNDAIQRGNKWRASQLVLKRLASEAEIRAGIAKLSKRFVPFHKEMLEEQLRWREALARSGRSEKDVYNSLQLALATRKLNWHLKRFKTDKLLRVAQAAWATRMTWTEPGAWETTVAWEALVAWETRGWGGLKARNLPGGLGAPGPVRLALAVFYAAKQSWISYDPLFLTTGLREAYHCGLESVFPISDNMLGWAMKK